ncbi:GNAT family N-acetyltransferase ['Paenibacillus yunnanensis' Narsing Rao et al. 2020]|uniref:GNAT family N-acetyltransferase n=1 Tax=Paenibacillus tengchongensis TaxID=2608684 RepID=UPI00124D5CCE|nr:GNAT family N-acetyltransferase [Paenibacillus tengchongensis]
MQLESQRLLIREFTDEDYGAVHSYASDPAVTEYMLWGPNTGEQTADYIRTVQEWQWQEPRTSFEFAVVLKDSGQLIGGCGLYVSEPRQGEIGYCFNSLYWKQGYASEAGEALLHFGFGELGLHRIFATCRPANTGSAKVMQKLGMTCEGLLREHRRKGETWHSSLVYAILEDEYRILQ